MNKTWKELLCMVLSAVMVLGLAACGSSKAEASAGDGDSTSGDTAADSIVLKMSTAQPEEHIASQTALRFADLIEQGTNGAVTVKMYFANSLGAQDVIVQGLMDGSMPSTFRTSSRFSTQVLLSQWETIIVLALAVSIYSCTPQVP